MLLDDSGTGLDRPIVTVAGYVATAHEWASFEPKARAYLEHHDIEVLHAVDFQKGRGAFRGWDGMRKRVFLEGLFDLFAPHAVFGICASAVHDRHRAKKAVTGLSKNQSAMGWCFGWILNTLLTDSEISPDDTPKLYLESGDRANSGIRSSFLAIRDEYGLHGRMLGIECVPKQSCVAIQLADMLAYYGRRHGEICERHKGEPVVWTPALSTMMQRVRARSILARDFFGNNDGSVHQPRGPGNPRLPGWVRPPR
jgi:hypothetical protein